MYVPRTLGDHHRYLNTLLYLKPNTVHNLVSDSTGEVELRLVVERVDVKLRRVYCYSGVVLGYASSSKWRVVTGDALDSRYVGCSVSIPSRVHPCMPLEPVPSFSRVFRAPAGEPYVLSESSYEEDRRMLPSKQQEAKQRAVGDLVGMAKATQHPDDWLRAQAETMTYTQPTDDWLKGIETSLVRDFVEQKQV